MQRKKLSDLNLLDDFLFGSLMSYPEMGEEFGRKLLKTIFNRNFGKLTIKTQKVLYGDDTDLHGARLDVFLEEETDAEAVSSIAKNAEHDSSIITENNTIYDIEPDKNNKENEIKFLPRRVRFYHAKIDGAVLKAGNDYDQLKRVIVIFITNYDPFMLNRMRYTVRNMCEEVPKMPYDDGAATIFLYTNGTEGNPPEELRQFLHYMEHTTRKNAVNETLQSIQKMVETVKTDGEVSLAYMKSWERDRMIYNEGVEEGKRKSREKCRIIEAEREKAEAEKERAETEREKAEAEKEKAEAEKEKAKAEISALKKEIQELKELAEKLK